MRTSQRLAVLAAAGLLVWANALPAHTAAQEPTPEPPLIQPGAPAPVPTFPPPPAPLIQHGAPAPVPTFPPPPSVPVPPVLVVPAVPPPDPAVPVVVLRVRVVACAPAGQELEYHLCLENCSPAAAHHVLVRNPLPKNARFVRAVPEPTSLEPELQWRLGTLPGGARCEIVLVLAPIDTDDVKNCARVQFEHGQCVCTRIARAAPPPAVPVPPPVPGTAIPVQPAVPHVPIGPVGMPKLALAMTGPKQQPVDQPATYAITVSNPGTAAAANVLVSGFLPAKAKFVSASGGGRFHAGQVAWLLGTLGPGTSRTVELVIRAEAAGELCTKATALADPDLKAQAEACTLFQGAPAMHFSIVDRRDPVPVGGETSYVILVWNQGQVPVTNVRIKALIPPALALLRAHGPVDNKLGEQTKEGQVLLFDPLPTIEPGGKREYEVYVKALRPGDVRFRAELTADQLKAGGPVHGQESTRIYAEENGGTAAPVVVPQSRRRGN